MKKRDGVLKCDGIVANDDHREVRSCGADDLFSFFFGALTFDIFDETFDEGSSSNDGTMSILSGENIFWEMPSTLR